MANDECSHSTSITVQRFKRTDNRYNREHKRMSSFGFNLTNIEEELKETTTTTTTDIIRKKSIVLKDC